MAWCSGIEIIHAQSTSLTMKINFTQADFHLILKEFKFLQEKKLVKYKNILISWLHTNKN